MRYIQFAIAYSVLLSLFGCNTLPRNEAALTVYSQPPGAMLYEGDNAWGMAPQQRTYFGNPNFATVQTKPITAIWPSGARVTKAITITLGRSDQYIILSRPPDAPDLDKDLTYAAQLRQQEIEKEKAAAQQRAATAAAISSIYANQPKPVYQIRPPTSTNCMMVGNMMNCNSY